MYIVLQRWNVYIILYITNGTICVVVQHITFMRLHYFNTELNVRKDYPSDYYIIIYYQTLCTLHYTIYKSHQSFWVGIFSPGGICSQYIFNFVSKIYFKSFTKKIPVIVKSRRGKMWTIRSTTIFIIYIIYSILVTGVIGRTVEVDTYRATTIFAPHKYIIYEYLEAWVTCRYLLQFTRISSCSK